ncbi:hypothetical protein [Mongoliimonas terrestris]|uniref:hypothetical protein n=1 Tax=Mongoliimonas terrestris TaxID=1709001 RepID=UPI00094989D8|nr:hypothetical protein [Mongoliimonas terrestris]
MSVHWIQTASGRAVDMVEPAAEMIDFPVDVAPALARLPRFGGQVQAGPYSVAQHCVVGAGVILEETGRADIAAAFLLHDAHEAYLGDLTRPLQNALAYFAGLAGGAYSLGAIDKGVQRAHCNKAVEEGIALIRSRFDAAIFAAAGVPLPHWHDEIARSVRHTDDRMLEMERLQLFGPCERPWTADPERKLRPIRQHGKLRIWSWPDAADRWMELFAKLCPAGIRTTARA